MAKKVVRLTESDLMNIVEQCVYEYQQTLINEGRLGNLARTAALGAGLAGGILGGMNGANAQSQYPNLSQDQIHAVDSNINSQIAQNIGDVNNCKYSLTISKASDFSHMYDKPSGDILYQETLHGLDDLLAELSALLNQLVNYKSYSYGKYAIFVKNITLPNGKMDKFIFDANTNNKIQTREKIKKYINQINTTEHNRFEELKSKQQQIQQKANLKRYQDSISAEELRNKYDTNVTVYNCKCTLMITHGHGTIFNHTFSNLQDLFDTIPLVANKAASKKTQYLNDFDIEVRLDIKGFPDELRFITVGLNQFLDNDKKTFNQIKTNCIAAVMLYQAEALCKANGLHLYTSETDSGTPTFSALGKDGNVYYVEFDKSGKAKLVNFKDSSFGVDDL